MEAIKQAKVLPILRICDTDFYVDIKLNEFRQVDAPENVISMKEIKASEKEATEFVFDRHTKNIYQEHIDPDHIPQHVKLVVVPPLWELDPPFLVQRLNLAEDAPTKLKPQQALKRKNGHKRKLSNH
jgi:hypothetical protein